MDHLFVFVPTVFWGFFAIMNPVANVPVFIGLTQNLTETERRLVAFKSIAIACIVISVFVVSGNAVFHLFGITIPAFQMAGGLLLFVVGFQMLHDSPHVNTLNNKKTRQHIQEKIESGNTEVAVSPLAVPILAGPGTIATALNFVSMKSPLDRIEKIAVVLIGFLVVCLITLVMFLGSSRILRLLGHGVISVISKIMGLILAVIGTQMVIIGIESLINKT